MNELSTERTMTVKEVAEVLKLTERTIQIKTKELFPELVKNGLETRLNETQVTILKNNLEKKFEVETSEDKKQILKRAFEILMDENEILKTKIEQDKPKVEFYDIVTASEDTVDMNEAAKILNFTGMGRTKLFAFLKDKRVLMQNKLPYQKYMDMGYFEIDEQPFQTPDGVTHIYNKTVVTQKGLEFIKNLYYSWKYAN